MAGQDLFGCVEPGAWTRWASGVRLGEGRESLATVSGSMTVAMPGVRIETCRVGLVPDQEVVETPRCRVPITRSLRAFIRGARDAVLTAWMSSLAKPASRHSVHFAPWSRSGKRSECARVPNSTAWILPRCTVQDPVG